MENASIAPATSAHTPKGLRQDEEEATDSDEVPEECPHRKCKEIKALKEPRREAFSKESHIMKLARKVYQRIHQANFEQGGSYNLSCLFSDGHIN